MPHIKDGDSIEDEFEKYWQDQKVLALGKLCEEEHLDKVQFQSLNRCIHLQRSRTDKRRGFSMFRQ